VFYLPDNRLAFIDFGMVGRLSMHRREQLLRLLLGLVQREPQTVVDVLLDWTGDGHAVRSTSWKAKSKPLSTSTTACRWPTSAWARCC